MDNTPTTISYKRGLALEEAVQSTLPLLEEELASVHKSIERHSQTLGRLYERRIAQEKEQQQLEQELGLASNIAHGVAAGNSLIDIEISQEEVRRDSCSKRAEMLEAVKAHLTEFVTQDGLPSRTVDSVRLSTRGNTALHALLTQIWSERLLNHGRVLDNRLDSVLSSGIVMDFGIDKGPFSVTGWGEIKRELSNTLSYVIQARLPLRQYELEVEHFLHVCAHYGRNESILAVSQILSELQKTYQAAYSISIAKLQAASSGQVGATGLLVACVAAVVAIISLFS